MTTQPPARDRDGVLLIICGPSGVGKSSLCHHLLDNFPRTRFSISYTTRAPRGQEQEGLDYRFVSREAFDAMIAADRFAEWAEVHGNRYGTARATVETALAEGTDLLFDIDVQGAAQLRRAFPDAVSVMVAPPSWEELEARLRGRKTDAEEVIARRLHIARHELSHFEAFDYAILNDDLDRACAELQAIYTAATLRVALRRPTLRRLLLTP